MNIEYFKRLRKTRKELCERAQGAALAATMTSYSVDEEGICHKTVKHVQSDGSIIKSTTRVVMNIPEGRNTLEQKEKAYRFTLSRLVKAILKESDKDTIENLALQIEHPQAKMNEALKNKTQSVVDRQRLISLIIEEEIVANSGENLAKVVERLKESTKINSNECAMEALDALSMPDPDNDIQR